MRLIAVVSLVVLATLPGHAQQSANPFSDTVRDAWNTIKRHVARSAAMLPEADYSFKPTATVRTFGEIIGHLINDRYAMCAGARGEKNPQEGADWEKKTAKAELVKGLADSTAYCDAAYGSLTDANAGQKVKLFGEEFTKFRALTINMTHDSEHYGNLVTYLRMKGHVPPSSARTGQ